VSGGPIINIITMPDGRIAVENARNQKELTREELREIPRAVHLWWTLMWEVHFPGETPEVNLP
jgi:hypothetical protein